MDALFRHNGRVILLTIVSVAFGGFGPMPPAIADSRVTILYHEPVELMGGTKFEQHGDTPGALEVIRFDAFGRRFEILLDVRSGLNERITNADFELFDGTLSTVPGSWVRLMRRGDELSGIIHDDSDTYIIEPRSSFSSYTDTTGESVNVVYRLADTLVAPGMLSCDTRPGDEPVAGKAAFSHLTAELNAVTPNTAAAHITTASVGVVADLDFFARFDSDSQSQIESFFNVVDGIYSEQVGIEIDLADSFIITSENEDPFSPTTSGSELLDELAEWRRLNQRDLALTHLVTDRDLTGEDPNDPIAGLSFFGVPGRAGVCFARSGAGLSTWVGTLTALIIAHEIGHNFGAPHDGEVSDDSSFPNPCESTPTPGFLMSASIGPGSSDQFSTCSIEEMQKVIDAADCLTSVDPSPNPPPAPSTSSAGGGGGGAFSGSGLIILLLIAVRRRIIADLPGRRRVAV